MISSDQSICTKHSGFKLTESSVSVRETKQNSGNPVLLPEPYAVVTARTVRTKLVAAAAVPIASIPPSACLLPCVAQCNLSSRHLTTSAAEIDHLPPYVSSELFPGLFLHIFFTTWSLQDASLSELCLKTLFSHQIIFCFSPTEKANR